jgi:hypothetical protein
VPDALGAGQAIPWPLEWTFNDLWAAENAATLLRAWQYPPQESVWTLVHAAKLGSWSLLVVVSIVLVAAVKAREGQLYGTARDLTVLRADEAPLELLPQRSPLPAPSSPFPQSAGQSVGAT